MRNRSHTCPADPSLRFPALACVLLLVSAAWVEGVAHAGESTDRADAAAYTRSELQVAVPDIDVITADGRRSSLRAELEVDGPVLVNFIFTSCSAICPVLSTAFAQMQQRMAAGNDRIRLVSISIDPEHDTPRALTAYAQRYRAGPDWRFLTGTVRDSVAAQRAFQVYRGNKMGHVPVTFIRARRGAPWVRIEGLASADALWREYRRAADS